MVISSVAHDAFTVTMMFVNNIVSSFTLARIDFDAVDGH
jgi:hypothetical protein